MYVNRYTRCTLIDRQKTEGQNKFIPTASPPLSLLSIDDTRFSPGSAIRRLL